MPSEIEYTNYKEFVESLSTTENPASSDKFVVSNPTNGPRSMPGSAKDRSTAITTFRTGDVIPVDGPNGPAKMSKDDLLKETSKRVFLADQNPVFVQGAIDFNDGSNVTKSDSLRSVFVIGTTKAIIIPPSGYYVRAICRYSNDTYPPSGDTYISADVANYNAAANYYKVDVDSNYYRIVLYKIDGTSADPNDADNLVMVDENCLTGLIYSDILSISSEIYDTGKIYLGFVQGTINVDDGTNVTWSKSLRSGYIPKSEVSAIIPPSGYYVRAICYYSDDTYPPSSSAFDHAVTFEYDEEQNFEVAEKTSNYYRIVLNKIDGSDSDVADSIGVILVSLSSLEGQILELYKKANSVGKKIYDTGKRNLGFVQGSINVDDGTNVTWSKSLRSGYIPKSEVSAIIPPSGYYVRAICYYTYETYPPSSSAFDYALTFEYDAKQNFEVAEKTSNYYRIVLNKIDGSDSDATDAAGVILVSLSSIEGQILELYKKCNSVSKGMKLVVTGDSIPHGQVMDGVPPSSPYPQIVATALEMNLKNYAIGGSTFAQSSDFGGLYANYDDFVADENKDASKIYVVMTGNQTYQDYSYKNGVWSTTSTSVRTPISARFQLMDDDADIVLVAAGTNDFQYNWTALGNMTDRIPNTFYGALHYTILGLLDKYLGKQIIFCTPIKRCQSPYTSVDSVNANGKTLEEYGQIIKEVCAYYSIPVIDLYSESGLNPQVSSQSPLFDSYKTHPYQKGHNMIARVVSGKIRSFRGSVS